ncbi:MAG TPA: hypothetical protein VGX70_19805 [Gemmataceae bacterium]|jgi:hypothetical protein|nr:hypothetical protein [Gemmataceae bacterium]
MQELIGLIECLADIFERLRLRYAFGGALANNYWGIVRATQDVDCLALIPALAWQQLADELTTHEFVLRDDKGRDQALTVTVIRAQAERQKYLEIWRHGIRAEIFLPVLPLQDEILRRAVAMPFQKRTILITTAEDLILLKMAFHRTKDVIDVRGILRVRRGQLDIDYMRHWSSVMFQDDVQRKFEELLREYEQPTGED